VAKKSKVLHLGSIGLDFILPEVFEMTKLVRLDLSFNNLVKISEEIGVLVKLEQLWLNYNPLREIPVALSNCK
jgi:Leucine-rich repeat (LRR) protein